jgi:ADA HAT complex component 1
LVSDDEDDYEAASDSDSPSSSEADDQEQEFRHIEVADDERNTAQSTATSEPKPGPSLNPTPQAAPIAHPLMRSRSKRSVLPFDRDEDDQRMSFVHHPNQDQSKTKRADKKKK